MFPRFLRPLLLAALLPLLSGCAANTDLTMAPPPTVDPTFKVEIPEPREDGRLPDWVQPQSYLLQLDIDPAAPRFGGEVVIDVAVAQPTSAFVLHAADLSVSRAEIVVGESRIRAEATTRKAAGATDQEEELVLVAASEIPAGSAKIHIEYSAPLETKLRGIYRVEDGDSTFVFTQFEPSDARRMFPCFDDPIYKVPFDLAVTVPVGNDVFANTPERARKTSGDSAKITVRFDTSQPMPTYLLALAIGPLEVLEGEKAPVALRVIAPKGKSKLGKLALKMAAEQLKLMTAYFDSAYPYKKLDLVAVPNFGPGAMENAGLVTFREELLLLDEKTASAKARRNMAMTIAHELAHQWFGNLVTMSWWDDLWLNEGFATHMESLIVDQWKPEMRADLEMLSYAGWVMDFDALTSARAVRQPVKNTYQAEEAFDGITYIKGASVIKMLQRWMGDDDFKKGIRNYLSKHAWRNAGGEDLFGALAAASHKNVAAVASSFLDHAGVPLVRAELTCERGKNASITLSQKRYSATPDNAAPPRLWQIPVCMDVGRSGRNKSERVCTLLATERTTVDLGSKTCPRWLLPNAGYDGYYRFAMSPAQLDKLASATRTQDPALKIGFLTNLWALVRAGAVDGSKMIDALAAHKREQKREVIEEVIEGLEHISGSLVNSEARPDFERFASALLLPHAKRLGWDPRKKDREDDKLLRRSVLTALAVLTDDGWMAKQAEKRALAFLTDPNSVDADAAAIALRVCARRRHAKVGFDELSAALKTAKSPGQRIAVVQALASLGGPNQLERALALLLDDTIRSGDAVYVMRAAIAWPDSRAVFIQWLGLHLEDLNERWQGSGVGRMVGAVGRVCDRRTRKTAARTLGPLSKTVPLTERRFREALENADICIDLRERQETAVSAYLTRLRL